MEQNNRKRERRMTNDYVTDINVGKIESDDCISRTATIDAIYKKYIGGKDAIKNAPINDLYAEGLAEAVDAVWDMPSVTPTRPTARWERLVEDYNKCSKCGEMGKLYRIYKYCPNCGARMETETKNRAGLNFADQDTMMSAT